MLIKHTFLLEEGVAAEQAEFYHHGQHALIASPMIHTGID